MKSHVISTWQSTTTAHGFKHDINFLYVWLWGLVLYCLANCLFVQCLEQNEDNTPCCAIYYNWENDNKSTWYTHEKFICFYLFIVRHDFKWKKAGEFSMNELYRLHSYVALWFSLSNSRLILFCEAWSLVNSSGYIYSLTQLAKYVLRTFCERSHWVLKTFWMLSERSKQAVYKRFLFF